jgi:hypothetical protein
MKKINLDWLLRNTFGINFTDVNLIHKWREPYKELHKDYTESDIEYVYGGFILSYSTNEWFNILVVDKEKFNKFKNQYLLPYCKFKRGLEEHQHHFYKYDLENLEVALHTWKLNIKDEFTEMLSDFVEKETFYWFDNFNRSGYRYKSKFKGWARKEMKSYKKACLV